MEYKKLLCICGTELLYSTIKTGGESYKVRSDGKPYSKPFNVQPMDFVMDNLYCISCDLTYATEWDSEDRLTRGAEI